MLANAARLAEKGIFVPIPRKARLAHHPLLHSIAGTPTGQHDAPDFDLMASIRAADADTAILSSEHLPRILKKREHGCRLVDLLRTVADRIVLLVFARNQPQRLNSVYAQRIKQFRSDMEFDEFRRCFETRALPHMDSYADMADAYGLELSARPYISTGGQKTDVLLEFMVATGIAADPQFSVPARSNVTPGPFTIEAAREIMRRLGGPCLFTKRQSNRAKATLVRLVRAQGISEPSYCGMTDGDARSISAMFAESNERFAQTAWGVSWDAIFHSDACQHFEPNDYRMTGVPADKADVLEEVVSIGLAEIETLRTNPDELDDRWRLSPARRAEREKTSIGDAM